MKENIKRLYSHYVSIGYDKARIDLENKYPKLSQPKAKEPITSDTKPSESIKSNLNSKPNVAKKKATREA